MEPLLQWVSTYGYFAIFGLLVLGIVGLPVPDETLLVFSGYLSSRGHLHLAAALPVAFLGSAGGITASYYLGRSLGWQVIHRYGRWFHVTENHVNKVHDWFGRLGHWALVVGYFIPGVRHLTAIVAGTSGLEYPQFALYAYAGALFWTSTFILLGYFLGDRWQTVYNHFHHQLILVAIVAAALGLLYYLYRRHRRKLR